MFTGVEIELEVQIKRCFFYTRMSKQTNKQTTHTAAAAVVLLLLLLLLVVVVVVVVVVPVLTFLKALM